MHILSIFLFFKQIYLIIAFKLINYIKKCIVMYNNVSLLMPQLHVISAKEIGRYVYGSLVA